MRSKLILSGLVLSALLVCSQKVVATTNVTAHRIIIDAGHGGSDPGSTMCDLKTEAEANLEVAKILQAKLEADRATVYMTRDGDETLDNRDRYTYANNTDGEILVSIHFNGSTDTGINYTQGLYAKWQKDIDLASTIHNQLFQSLGISDGGLLQFASGVILKAEMPATIQEVAFISNSTECSLLTDGTDARQEAIAQSLYNGLNDWFGNEQIPTKPRNRK